MVTLNNIHNQSRKLNKEKRVKRQSFKARVKVAKPSRTGVLVPTAHGIGKRIRRKLTLSKHAQNELVAKGLLIRDTEMEDANQDLALISLGTAKANTKAKKLAAKRKEAEQDMCVDVVEGPGTTLGGLPISI